MHYLMLLQVTASSTGPSEVRDAVYQLTDFLIKYLTPLVAVGAFAMAFVELWKKLLDKRTKFQARRWISWMARLDDGSDVEENHEPALGQLLQLTTGVSEAEARKEAGLLLKAGGLPGGFTRTRTPAHAVFALELERMMGAIQEAADVVLANPQKYVSLYRLLTAGAKPEDVNTWLQKGPSAMLDAAKLPESQQREAVKAQSELFARLRQTIKGKLDGFQLYTADSWANWNQLAANITGMVVMFVSLMFSSWSRRNTGFSLTELGNAFEGSMIPISLVGGILSPVAKDLVSALQNVKNG